MRITWIILLAILGVGPAFGAEQFQLKSDANGQAYGPFEFEDGAKINLGKDSFTVVRVGGARAEMERKLNAIILPTVKIDGARLDSVLNFIVEEARRLDKGHKGINLTLAAPAPQKAITLNLRDVSVAEVFKAIELQTGTKFQVEPSGLVTCTPPVAGTR